MKISIPSKHVVKAHVPGSVFRQPAFSFDPQPFKVEWEKYEDRFIEEDVLTESIEHFLADPSDPITYCVSGNPDDMQAKYFAAWLAMKHMEAVKFPKVVWEPLYGDFRNPLIKERDRSITLIVISNLCLNATNVKLEKARDILEFYDNVPRIVVAAGTDPITFMSSKLFLPTQAVTYFHSGRLKTDYL